ncbi:uncharacterized protein TRIADDRAFT_54401 [Trichoplax adhaerens]|uniref:Angio-associated migratory cell protein n=1 Tax=Trichoplax adhaerens TaxID=10228 RepID=B3RRX6_TRIAD|nr:hypothetical protein TRIADDRAFT_54401 [Trichoplax adhaerens]EDV26425.1 hypothetical protein TRIADDRAFT_54401 [Trichoplax adhaerens]|eukprot:XP_002110421.1 hypothetical protein TRIADDRAFT_54401 [Trichoplax adhaerens]
MTENGYEVVDVNDGDAAAESEDDMNDEEFAEGAMGPSDDEEIQAYSRSYRQHQGSVFSVAIDPANGNLALTGGEDDVAYLWSLENGNILLECKGHKDSVTCVSFSSNSKYFATGDMSGIVKVWEVEKKQEIFSAECSDIEWMEWHSNYPVLLAGAIDGNVWMWQIPTGLCKMCQSHGSKSTCGKVFNDGNRACFGYEDGSIKIVDLRTLSTLYHISGNTGHSDAVTSIDIYSDGILIATSSLDGSIKVINSANGRVVLTHAASWPDNSNNDNNTNTEAEKSVEAISFSKLQTLLASASLNGDLAIWDLPTQRLRHRCKHEGGVSKLLWNPAKPLLYTGGLNGNILVWDGLNGECLKVWHGHYDEILDLAISGYVTLSKVFII